MPRHFDNWLNAYMDFTFYSEAPATFNFWTGVSTLAGALRRRVWVDEITFQWTPNFYIVLVADPGVCVKTTTIRTGLRLLEEVPDIVWGPNSMTWQGLTTAMQEAVRSYQVGDDPLNMIKMSCVTCKVNELGTFLRPDDGELVDNLVDLWDGQLDIWRRKLKTEDDTTIVNPWINVIGGTTPDWLRRNFNEGMMGGGLGSRIVFVYSDEKRHLISYPSRMIRKDDYYGTRNKLIEDLTHISELIGEYELSPEAYAWGDKWYKGHWDKIPEHLRGEHFKGWRARKQGHMHKLALIMTAAASDKPIIELPTLQLALKMVEQLETHMKTVFSTVGAGGAAKNVGEMMALIRAYKTIDHRTLWRHLMSIMDAKEFGLAEDAAIRAGYLVTSGVGSTKTYSLTNPNKEQSNGE